VVHVLLLALSHGPRHGYLLIQEVEELSERALRLDPGTLYRWLARLLDDGLIVEAPSPAPSDDDARRRYYHLTARGRQALEGENERLARLLARASREVEG
jgi:DNA-binding PadR family transcriptional regulator